MNSSNSLRVAVIGYGYWSPKLIRNLSAVEGAHLVAVCEKDVTRHEMIAREHAGVKIYAHYEEAFSDSTIDAVIIATIPSSHFRIAKQALEAGKHVLVEKPLVLSTEEGEVLLQLAKKHKRVLMVDHTYLYTEGIRSLKKLLDEGVLGKVFSIESTRINLGLFQRDSNVVWDLAPHDISILLYLLPEKPTHVSVVGTKTIVHKKQTRMQESDAHLTLYYKSGYTAHVHVSWISPVKVRQLTITGSDKMAMYDQLADNPLVVFDQGVYVNEDEGESGPLFVYKTGEKVPVPLQGGGEDLQTMLTDFVSSIREKKSPVSHAEIGLSVVRILEACERSLARQGARERISYEAGSPLVRALLTVRPR